MPRPKSPNPLTPTERTERYRQAMVRKEVLLPPEAWAKAERLMHQRGLKFAPMVEDLIARAKL